MRKRYGASIAISVALLTVCACKTADGTTQRSAYPENRSGYYAVMLDNNQVVYGKLQGIGTAYPVLTDVRFVRTIVDRTTKQVSSSLVKRGAESHEPDHMILNANHILLIEPVGVNSRVAAILRGDAAKN